MADDLGYECIGANVPQEETTSEPVHEGHSRDVPPFSRAKRLGARGPPAL
jgi:hypothetical protein